MVKGNKEKKKKRLSIAVISILNHEYNEYISLFFLIQPKKYINYLIYL